MSSSVTTSHRACHHALSEPAQTFHLFPQLPAELRLKIWAYNLPGPRVVTIRCGSGPSLSLSSTTPSPFPSPSPSPPPPSRRPWCTAPGTPLPANLHVCHEARAEALRRYLRLFGLSGQPGHVFFDPSRDVLAFGPRPGYMAADAQMRTLLSLADPADCARVRRVAVSESLWTLGGRVGPGPAPVPTPAPAPAPARHRQRPIRRSGDNGDNSDGGEGEGDDSGSSLLAVRLAADVLDHLRTRLLGLRTLVVVSQEKEEDDANDNHCTAAGKLVPLITAGSVVIAPWHHRTRLDDRLCYHDSETSSSTASLARVVQAALRRLRASTPPTAVTDIAEWEVLFSPSSGSLAAAVAAYPFRDDAIASSHVATRSQHTVLTARPRPGRKPRALLPKTSSRGVAAGCCSSCSSGGERLGGNTATSIVTATATGVASGVATVKCPLTLRSVVGHGHAHARMSSTRGAVRMRYRNM